MLSPDQIRTRALNLYECFLQSLVDRQEIFPLILPGSGMSRPTEYARDQQAIQTLRDHSKELTGTGYTLHWKQQSSRRFGEQSIPAEISFQSRHDFTRFLNKCAEVQRFEEDAALLATTFPELAPWIRAHPRRLIEHAGHWEGLIRVCAHLRHHGRPNCYPRELPVDVDTKFIERKRCILGEILPILAPNCVGPDATSFESRFGFRQKQPMVRLRTLDNQLLGPDQFPLAEFAVPLSTANQLTSRAQVALIVENEITFLTLPALPLTIAMLGSGDAVAAFKNIEWLAKLRVVYWGDLDTHGFEALSLLRETHSHAESILMDLSTFRRFEEYAKPAAPYRSDTPGHLTSPEQELFEWLRSEQRLLEQERIPLQHAAHELGALLDSKLFGGPTNCTNRHEC